MRVWPQPCRAAVPCVSRCFSAGCLFIRCQCLIVFMFNSVELQPCLALSRARARIVCGNCARPSENFPRLRIAQIVRHATAPLVRVGPSKRRKASVLYACACACARARACTGGAAFCSRTGRAAAQPQTRAPAASGVFGFAQDGSFARGSAIVWASGASVRGWRPGSSWHLRGQWECWQQLIHRFGRAVWMGGIVVFTDVRH